MNKYVLRSEVMLSAAFKVGSVDTDPATVEFKIKGGRGGAASFSYPGGSEIVKDAIGKYHISIIVGEAGLYTYRFEGAGACFFASESQFIVNSSEFYP